MQGQNAIERRLSALKQHLTAASLTAEKAPHVSMEATAAQSQSVWQQIPQVCLSMSHVADDISHRTLW